jgi:hypothetical protein
LSLHSIKFTDYIHQETTTGVGKTPLDKEQRTLTPNCLTNKAGKGVIAGSPYIAKLEALIDFKAWSRKLDIDS